MSARSLTLWIGSVVFTASFASSWPPDISLPEHEALSLQAAVQSVLPPKVAVQEVYAFKERDGAPLSAHAISDPYQIGATTFSVDAVACTKAEGEGWDCLNYATLAHVYVESLEQSFWLKDGVAAEDGALILAAALRDCALNFSVRYRDRPQVTYSADDGVYRVWAPGCRSSYRIAEGAVQRQEEFSNGAAYGT